MDESNSILILSRESLGTKKDTGCGAFVGDSRLYRNRFVLFVSWTEFLLGASVVISAIRRFQFGSNRLALGNLQSEKLRLTEELTRLEFASARAEAIDLKVTMIDGGIFLMLQRFSGDVASAKAATI